MICNPVHIAPDGIFVKTPDIDNDLAAVEVEVEIHNDTYMFHHLEICALINDAEGNETAFGRIPATAGEGEKNTYRSTGYTSERRKHSCSICRGNGLPGSYPAPYPLVHDTFRKTSIPGLIKGFIHRSPCFF